MLFRSYRCSTFFQILCFWFSLKIFLFIIYFLFLFLAVLGLRFCVRAFSSFGEWRPLFIALRGPLTIATSHVAEHRLQMRRLSNCGSRAQPLRGMWDLPRPGLEPVSLALAGRFSTTAPPGKSPHILFNFRLCLKMESLVFCKDANVDDHREGLPPLANSGNIFCIFMPAGN